LSRVARKRGDRARARRLLEEDLATARQDRADRAICATLLHLAELDWADDDPLGGQARLVEGLGLARRQRNRQYPALGLIVAACRALGIGRPVRAARLFGAADAVLPDLRFESDGPDIADYKRALVEVRAALTAEAFALAWAEGKAMTVEEAITYAMDAGGG